MYILKKGAWWNPEKNCSLIGYDVMKKFLTILNAAALFFFPLIASVNAQVRITEFLADNVSTNPDMYDFDDFSDWIELHNEGSSTIDLSGYSLTGNLNNPKKSIIPSGVSIPAGGYLLFWADKHNSIPGTPEKRPDDQESAYTTKYYHCDFKLDKEGEQVGLFDPDGKVVDSITFGPQLADVSMGRNPADGSWCYFDRPTPGAPNSTTAKRLPQRSGAVSFSIDAGFYSGAQSVTLTSSDNSPIYYTVDGSIPNDSSLKYSSPVSVSASMPIRARTITSDKIAGMTVTNTYFIESPRKLMVVNISAPPRFLNDGLIGILRTYYKFRKVPVMLEFFDTAGKPAVRCNAGIEVGTLNGYWCAQKPLQIDLTARYGDEFVEFPFFQRPYTKFNKLRLRQGSDAWATNFIADDLLDPISTGQMAYGVQAYKPVVCYINGKYDGIRDLREQFKGTYLRNNYGVDTAGIKEIRRTLLPDDSEGWQVVHGSWSDYGVMMDLVKSGTINYSDVKRQIDINGMIDFVVMESFVLNSSWGHNEDFWKVPATTWHWLASDIDRAWDYTKVDEGAISGDFIWRDTLFTRLMGVAEFKNHFAQRYAAHINSTLKAGRLNRIIDSVTAMLAPEMPSHSSKWRNRAGIESVQAWLTAIDSLKKFCSERAPYVWSDLDQEISTGHAGLTVVVTNAAGGDIFIEGVRMGEGLSGMTFFKDIPITIKAIPKSGCAFKSWGGAATGTSDSTTITLTGDQTITAEFIGTPNPVISPVRTKQQVFNCTDRTAVSHGMVTFIVSISTPLEDRLSISLFTVSGRKLGTVMNVDIGPGTRLITATTHTYAPGIYFYRIKTKTIDELRRISLR
jgi:hypothetical protein